MGGLRLGILRTLVLLLGVLVCVWADKQITIDVSRTFYVSASQYTSNRFWYSEESPGDTTVTCVGCGASETLTVWSFNRASLPALKPPSIVSAILISDWSPSAPNQPVEFSELPYPTNNVGSTVCSNDSNFCYWPAMYDYASCPSEANGECTGELIGQAPFINAVGTASIGNQPVNVTVTSLFANWVDYDSAILRTYFNIRVGSPSQASFPAANKVGAAQLVVTLESIPPNATIAAAANETNIRQAVDGNYYSKAGAFLLDITFTEEVLAGFTITPTPDNQQLISASGSPTVVRVGYSGSDGQTIAITVSGAQDYAGNDQVQDVVFSVTIDLTLPALGASFPTALSTIGAQKNVSIFFVERVEIANYSMSVTVDNPSYSPVTSIEFVEFDGDRAYTFLLSSSYGETGTPVEVTINANVIDYAGNALAQVTIPFLLESVRPSILSASVYLNLNGLYTSNHRRCPFDVVVLWDQNVVAPTGLNITDSNALVSGVSVSPSGVASSYTYTVACSGDGDITIDVITEGAVDENVNPANAYSNPQDIVIDNTPPFVLTDSEEPAAQTRVGGPFEFSHTVVFSEPVYYGDAGLVAELDLSVPYFINFTDSTTMLGNVTLNMTNTDSNLGRVRWVASAIFDEAGNALVADYQTEYIVDLDPPALLTTEPLGGADITTVFPVPDTGNGDAQYITFTLSEDTNMDLLRDFPGTCGFTNDTSFSLVTPTIVNNTVRFELTYGVEVNTYLTVSISHDCLVDDLGNAQTENLDVVYFVKLTRPEYVSLTVENCTLADPSTLNAPCQLQFVLTESVVTIDSASVFMVSVPAVLEFTTNTVGPSDTWVFDITYLGPQGSVDISINTDYLKQNVTDPFHNFYSFNEAEGTLTLTVDTISPIVFNETTTPEEGGIPPYRVAITGVVNFTEPVYDPVAETSQPWALISQFVPTASGTPPATTWDYTIVFDPEFTSVATVQLTVKDAVDGANNTMITFTRSWNVDQQSPAVVTDVAGLFDSNLLHDEYYELEFSENVTAPTADCLVWNSTLPSVKVEQLSETTYRFFRPSVTELPDTVAGYPVSLSSDNCPSIVADASGNAWNETFPWVVFFDREGPTVTILPPFCGSTVSANPIVLVDFADVVSSELDASLYFGGTVLNETTDFVASAFGVSPWSFSNFTLDQSNYASQVAVVTVAGVDDNNNPFSTSCSVTVDSTPPQIDSSDPFTGQRITLVDIAGTPGLQLYVRFVTDDIDTSPALLGNIVVSISVQGDSTGTTCTVASFDPTPLLPIICQISNAALQNGNATVSFYGVSDVVGNTVPSGSPLTVDFVIDTIAPIPTLSPPSLTHIKVGDIITLTYSEDIFDLLPTDISFQLVTPSVDGDWTLSPFEIFADTVTQISEYDGVSEVWSVTVPTLPFQGQYNLVIRGEDIATNELLGDAAKIGWYVYDTLGPLVGAYIEPPSPTNILTACRGINRAYLAGTITGNDIAGTPDPATVFLGDGSLFLDASVAAIESKLTFSGFLVVPYTGSYQFGCVAGGNCEMTIEATNIFDPVLFDADNLATRVSNPISLTGGSIVSVQLTVIRSAAAPQVVRLSWLTPAGMAELVPMEHLRLAASCTVGRNPTIKFRFSETENVTAAQLPDNWITAVDSSSNVYAPHEYFFDGSGFLQYVQFVGLPDGPITITMDNTLVGDVFGNPALIPISLWSFVIDATPPTRQLDVANNTRGQQLDNSLSVIVEHGEIVDATGLFIVTTDPPIVVFALYEYVSSTAYRVEWNVSAGPTDLDYFVYAPLRNVSDIYGNVLSSEIWVYHVDNVLLPPAFGPTSCSKGNFTATWTFAEALSFASFEPLSGPCILNGTVYYPGEGNTTVAADVICDQETVMTVSFANMFAFDLYGNRWDATGTYEVQIDGVAPTASITPTSPSGFGSTETWQVTLTEPIHGYPDITVRTGTTLADAEANCTLVPVDCSGSVCTVEVDDCAVYQDVYVVMDGSLIQDCAGNEFGILAFGPYTTDPRQPVVELTVQSTWDGSAWDGVTTFMNQVVGTTSQIQLNYTQGVSNVDASIVACDVDGSAVPVTCISCVDGEQIFTFELVIPADLDRVLIVCTPQIGSVQNQYGLSPLPASPVSFRGLTTNATATPMAFVSISPSYISGTTPVIGEFANVTVEFSRPVSVPDPNVFTLTGSSGVLVSVPSLAGVLGTEDGNAPGFFTQWTFVAHSARSPPTSTGPPPYFSLVTLSGLFDNSASTLRITDPLGNVASDSVASTTLFVDVNRPVRQSIGPINVGAKIPGSYYAMTITFSEQIAIPSANSISTSMSSPLCTVASLGSNPDFGTFASSFTWYWSFAGNISCTLTTNLLATGDIVDRSGNPPSLSSSIWTYIVDLEPPTISVLSPANGAFVPATFTVSFEFSESILDFTASDFTVASDAAGCVPGPLNGGPLAFSIDFTCTQSGNITLSIPAGSLNDTFLNPFQGLSWTYQVDTIRPSVSLNEALHPDNWVWPHPVGTLDLNLLFSERVRPADFTSSSFAWSTTGVKILPPQSQVYTDASLSAVVNPGTVEVDTQDYGTISLTVSGVRDIAGNTVYSKTFIWDVDLHPPTVDEVFAVAPRASEGTLPRDFIVRVRFNEPVDIASTFTAYLSPLLNGVPTGLVTWGALTPYGTPAIINDAAFYLEWEIYATVSSDIDSGLTFAFQKQTTDPDIVDGSHNVLADMTTAVESVSYSVDTLPPVVTDAKPALQDAKVGPQTIPRSSNFVFVFNEEVVNVSSSHFVALQNGSPVPDVSVAISGIYNAWVFLVTFPADFDPTDPVTVHLTQSSDRWGNNIVTPWIIDPIYVDMSIPTADLFPRIPVRDTITYTLNISEPVFGLTESMIDVKLTALPGETGPDITGSIVGSSFTNTTEDATGYSFQVQYQENGGVLQAHAMINIRGGVATDVHGNFYPGQTFVSLVDYKSVEVDNVSPVATALTTTVDIGIAFTELIDPATASITINYPDVTGTDITVDVPFAQSGLDPLVWTVRVTFSDAHPDTELAYITVPGTVTDLAGNALSGGDFTFSRLVLHNAPVIVSFTPAPGSTVKPTGVVMQVQFSKEVTLTASDIQVDPLLARVDPTSVTSGADRSAWQFAITFFQDANVTITISTAVADDAGLTLATLPANPNTVTYVVDATAPVVLALNPLPFVTVLGANFTINAYYDELVGGSTSFLSVEGTILATATCVAHVCAYEVTNFPVTGAFNFEFSGATDASGNVMRPVLLGYNVDVTAPLVMVTSFPSTVGANATLRVTYDEPIDITDATMTFSAGIVTIDTVSQPQPDAIEFVLSGVSQTAVDASITLSGVKDLHDNPAADYVISVVATVDLTAPAILEIVPTDSAFINSLNPLRVTVVFDDDTIDQFDEEGVTILAPAAATLAKIPFRVDGFSWAFDISGFAQGDTITIVVADVEDRYGNVITSSQVSYTVDAVAPTVTAVNVVPSNTYNGVVYAYVNNPVVSVTLGETVSTPATSTLVWSFATGSVSPASVSPGATDFIYAPASNLPEGPVNIVIRDIADAAGNKITPYLQPIVVDSLAPTYLITAPAATVGVNVTLTVRLSEPVRLFDDTVFRNLDTAAHLSAIRSVGSAGVVYEVELVNLPGGILSIGLGVVDYTGLSSNPTPSNITTVDALLPTILSVTPSSGTFRGMPSLTVRVQFSEAVVASDASFIATQGGSPRTIAVLRVQTPAMSGDTFDVTMSGLTDGALDLSVSEFPIPVVDLYGNVMDRVSPAATFTIDQVAPSVDSLTVVGLVGGQYINTATATVKIAFTDSDVVIGNNNVAALQPGQPPLVGTVSLTGAVATATIPGLIEGPVSFEITGVTDAVGNVMPRGLYVGYVEDTVGPIASIDAPAAMSTIGYVATLTVSFTEVPVTFNASYVVVSTGSTPTVAPTANPKVFQVTIDNTLAGIATNDVVTVSISGVVDAASNSLQAFTPVGFVIDVTSATLTDIKPARGSNLRVIDGALVVELTLSEAVQTFDNTAISFSGSAAASASLSVKRGAADRYTLVFTQLVDGQIDIAFSPSNEVVDVFNNPSVADSWSYTLDSTAPTVMTTSVAPTTVDSLYIPSDTVTITVTFAELVTGVTVGSVNWLQSSVSKPSVASTDFDGSTFDFTSPTLNNGEVTVTISGFTDAVGNSFGGVAYNFVIDTVDPTFTTIPAAGSLPPLGKTATITVAFSEPLRAFDNNTNLYIWPATVHVDQVVQTFVGPNSEVYAITLSNLDDSSNLTLGFRNLFDRAQRAVATPDQEFIVDTTAPVLVDVTPPPLSSDPATVHSGSLSIRMTVSESLAMAPAVDITVSDAGATKLFYRDTSAIGTVYRLELGNLQSGNLSIFVSANFQWVDYSGNHMPVQILQYSIDADAPTPVGITPTPDTPISFIRPNDVLIVTFTEDVLNVAPANLEFRQNGHVTLVAASSSGSGSSWDFTVPSGVVDGFITVAVVPAAAADVAGNVLTGATWTYVVDLTNAGASIIPAAGSVIAAKFNATIAFREAPIGFTTANVALSQAQATVDSVIQDGSNQLVYYVAISSLNQNVSAIVTLSLTNLADAANNSFTDSWVFNVDTTKPYIVTIIPAADSVVPAMGGFVDITFTFSEPIKRPSTGSMLVSQAGSSPIITSAPVTDVDDSTAWTWRVRNVGDGALSVTLSSAGSIVDLLNNPMTATLITINVDAVAPKVSSALFEDRPVFALETTLNITFSESVLNMDLSDLVSSQGVMSLQVSGTLADAIYQVTLFNLKPGPVSVSFALGTDVTDAVGNRLHPASWSFQVLVPAANPLTQRITPVVECFYIDDATNARVAYLGYDNAEVGAVAIMNGQYNNLVNSQDLPIEAFFPGRHVLVGSVNLDDVNSAFVWNLANFVLNAPASAIASAKCPTAVTLLIEAAEQPTATELDAIREALAAVAGVPSSSFAINGDQSGASKKRAGYTVAVDVTSPNAAGTASNITNAPSSTVAGAYVAAGVPAGVSSDITTSATGLGTVQGHVIPAAPQAELVTGLTGGGIVGVVIACVVAGLVVGAVIMFIVMRFRNRKQKENQPKSASSPKGGAKPLHVDDAPVVAPAPAAGTHKKGKKGKGAVAPPPAPVAAPPVRGRSPTRSVDGSYSRSRSRSDSRSRSRSPTPSQSRSGSWTRSYSGSRTPSDSRSRTRSYSGSRSPSPSGSRSPSRSASRSSYRSRSESASRSRSPSRSHSASHSGSPSRSPSPSRSESGEARFDD